MVETAGEETGLTAMAYRPGEKGQRMQLLSGGLSQQLVMNRHQPIIALPWVETG